MKLKILGKRYTIKEVDSSELPEGTMGTCNKWDLVIKIAKGQPTEVRRDTLFHEIEHAIWTETGLQHGKVTEERCADAHGRAWAAIISDNPASVIEELFA